MGLCVKAAQGTSKQRTLFSREENQWRRFVVCLRSDSEMPLLLAAEKKFVKIFISTKLLKRVQNAFAFRPRAMPRRALLKDASLSSWGSYRLPNAFKHNSASKAAIESAVYIAKKKL